MYLLKVRDKIAQIIEAVAIGNLRDGIIGGGELAAGLLDPLAVEVIHWCPDGSFQKKNGRNIWVTWKRSLTAAAR